MKTMTIFVIAVVFIIFMLCLNHVNFNLNLFFVFDFVVFIVTDFIFIFISFIVSFFVKFVSIFDFILIKFALVWIFRIFHFRSEFDVCRNWAIVSILWIIHVSDLLFKKITTALIAIYISVDRVLKWLIYKSFELRKSIWICQLESNIYVIVELV